MFLDRIGIFTFMKPIKFIEGEELTIKEAKFCRDYIRHEGNAAKAYKTAYKCKSTNSNTIARNAYKIKHRPKVAKVIEKLQRKMEKKLEISLDTQVRKLEGIYIEALADKEYTPAISAVNSQSKHLGLISDKPTATINVTFQEAEREVRELTPERRALLREIIEGQCQEVE